MYIECEGMETKERKYPSLNIQFTGCIKGDEKAYNLG